MSSTLLFLFCIERSVILVNKLPKLSWVVCYLMKAMYLRMKAIYLPIDVLNLLIQTVQKPTRILIMSNSFRRAKLQRTIRMRGWLRRQSTSRRIVQNVTMESHPQELQRQKPERSPEDIWVSNPPDPLHFNSRFKQVH